MSIEELVRDEAKRAKVAASALALKTSDERDAALETMAQALVSATEEIVAANAKDVQAAKEAGTKDSLIDRLMLDEARVKDMADALVALTKLPDPVGRTLMESTLPNGLEVKRVSVPLGVVAVIYEARPNVTADAAGICLKSGNACILRGGSMAAHSNATISEVLARAAESAGMPVDCIQCIDVTDRAATDVLLSLHGLIDVVVPRGGAGLISHCVDVAKVPVIETGTGNCHIYLHASADPEMAKKIVENAKCRRYGVCNAAETLLVDESAAQDLLPEVLKALGEHDVLLHMDGPSLEIANGMQDAAISALPATDDDWGTEYLAPEISVKCVSGVDEAITHVNEYGTGHSEAIVAKDAQAIEQFLNGVDAACVYANASTAFTDGGQFGLGAEIGISTQKLHVRGPFATEALTSYKYVITGGGQVRA